jgi:hypothetical protein
MHLKHKLQRELNLPRWPVAAIADASDANGACRKLNCVCERVEELRPEDDISVFGDGELSLQ